MKGMLRSHCLHHHSSQLCICRSRLSVLRQHFLPTRTTLITTLSAIFPIELLSPPDLLFTILSVPLPIPLSTTDPGPPLSLPDHKEVTEDAVATALGYAAQVVQMLAAYLGKGLVYPVTCVGSRSLIRDGISAMVGPRMSALPEIFKSILIV
jgi:UV radiation resistance-associated gene protein